MGSSEGSNVLRAHFKNFCLEFFHQEIRELVFRHAVWPTVGIGRREVMDEIREVMEILRAVAIAVANGNREVSRTMVGIMPRDNVLARRLAPPRMIEMGKPDCRVV